MLIAGSAGAGSCFCWGLSTSSNGGCTTSLGNLFQCLITLIVKGFLYAQMEFPSFCAHCILFCCWGPLLSMWAPSSLLSHQVLIHMDRVSLSLLQGEQSQLSQPLVYVKCSKPFIITLDICWIHPTMPMSLLHWGAQSWTQHSMCISLVLSKEEGSLLSVCWQCVS